MPGDSEKLIGDLSRLAELGRIFARHGAMNLGNALGIAPFPEEDVSPEHLRPKSMVALLRDIGPIGVKLGQLLATGARHHLNPRQTKLRKPHELG